MLDVMFVLMLFFMVMAGSVKIERELNTKLPGNAPTSESVDFPDEQIISIAANGDVLLNDEPIETAASNKSLPQLSAAMQRLKQNADAAKTELLVTLVSEGDTPYSRAVQVLDALALCEIKGVTFSTTDDSVSQ
jgi:biopolymer transport protein ExbD